MATIKEMKKAVRMLTPDTGNWTQTRCHFKIVGTSLQKLEEISNLGGSNSLKVRWISKSKATVTPEGILQDEQGQNRTWIRKILFSRFEVLQKVSFKSM